MATIEKDSVKIGLNRTGVHASSALAQEMVEANEEFMKLLAPESQPGLTIAELRQAYIDEAEQLGTVSMPARIKGLIELGLDKIKSLKPGSTAPEVFVDKLGERLAFERTGIRLYDALITKCEAVMPEKPVQELYDIRDEEQKHYHLLRRVIEQLGGDPTVQAPAADASAVLCLGVVQILTDPRTTIQQCVEAVLLAELADNAGWDLLIQLAEASGHSEFMEEFSMAKADEEAHIEHIQFWLEELVLQNKAVSMH